MTEGAPNPSTVWLFAIGWLSATMVIRMLAPLLGVFAEGLGITLVTAGIVLAIFELTGLVAPAVGWLLDRLGPRSTAGLGVGGLVAGALLSAASPSVWVFTIGLVLLALGGNLYEAAALSWISSASGFDKRAAWLGRFELAWPAGLLIGLPVAALLTLWSWRAAFVAVIVPVLSVAVSLARRIEPKLPVDGVDAGRDWTWRAVRHGLPTFAAGSTLSLSSQLVVVTFGVWLTDRFGYTAAVIAIVGFGFGVGDLLAGAANIAWTDRLGKVRATAIGSGVVALGGLALSLVTSEVIVAVAAIGVLLVGYEFAFLALKPLFTEVDPDNRGLGLGIGFGTTAVARAVGALLATALYGRVGFVGVAVTSALLGALACGLFTFAVREPAPTGSPVG